MICHSLRYLSFRNIEHAAFRLHEEVTVFHGLNAQGKTNLLEGIYLASQGRSFRCRRDHEMVRHGDPFGQVTVGYSDANRSGQSITLRLRGDNKPGRYCEKNGVRLTRHSELVGSFRTVLFTPSHLDLVSGSPEVRRHFMDMAICQLSPAYLSAFQRYNRLLEQRNAYLRRLREENPMMSVMDDAAQVLTEAMAKEGSEIIRMRRRYLDALLIQIKTVFSDMVGEGEKPNLIYREEADEQGLYRLMESHFRDDLLKGTTANGPHRSDFTLQLNGRAMKGEASQGQTRSMALAMKLGEGEVSKRASGEYPVYLLDDVLSELDKNRRSYLLSGVIPGQVIITSCDPIDKQGLIFRIKNGTVDDGGAGYLIRE